MSGDFQALQRQFAAHIRDPENNPPPEGIESRRLRIYRRLFYNNVQGFLYNGFPVLRSLYAEKRWHDLVQQFFSGHASQTPYFVEIPGEFVTWLCDEYEPAADDPPFLAELAHYEYMEVVLRSSTSTLEEVPCNPEGDLLAGAPVVSPLVRVLSYEWPVHRIGKAFQPDSPLEKPVWLIIYRTRSDHVRFMEINTATARLLALIEQRPQHSGRALLEELAAELGHASSEEVVGFGADMLEKLRERDIIPGTRIKSVQ